MMDTHSQQGTATSVDIAESEIDSLLTVTPKDVEQSKKLSYARNVFIPLTTACRYSCTYCTYFDPPGEANLLSPREIREIVRQGADAGCTEALFTFGDDPDSSYTQIHKQLTNLGHDSIHSYLREACEIALDEGLLPHANPGDQTQAEMQSVAHLNASMGVMLETTANVAAHGGRREKTPAQRINTIRTAGQLHIPFTTGILIGIGEDWRDRAESLLTITRFHERYGHIQEVIVQPVVENERWRGGEPDIDTLRRTVAMARVALPEDVSLQVPPNLAPAGEVIDCGIDDLGGVSPVTDDHINPSYDWPELTRLRDIADDAGVPLHERLPIYERYLPAELRSENFNGQPATPISNGMWLSERIHAELTAATAAGQRYRSVICD